MDLIALEELRRLKYRYLRTMDTKRWDEFAQTLTPDATAVYGERLTFDDRDGLVTFLRGALGPGMITVHTCDRPEIDVNGDTATGTWALEDTVIMVKHRLMLRGAAFYEDRYVRGDDGRWRIAHTGYERIYEATMSLDDIPSFRLTANRWSAMDAEDDEHAAHH